MLRPFSDADVVQEADGDAEAAATVDVTLPAGTTEGMGGVILIKAGTLLEPPQSWDRAADNIDAGSLAIFYRLGMPAGETTWLFDAFGAGAPDWVWKVEEWANLGRMLTSVSASGLTGATSVSTGTTGSWPADYVLAVAAFSQYKNTTDGNVWPAVGAPTNGFVTVGTYQHGTGSGGADVQITVARRFGTADETGPWESTVTFTGTSTNIRPQAAMAVFRAAEREEPWNAGQAVQVG